MSSGENPYRAPMADLGGSRVVGIRSGKRKDLRDVAVAQKGVLVCILLQLLLFGAQFFVPQNAKMAVGIIMLASGLVATVFVFMLSIKVYSTALGIVFGILAMFPCIGLIVLLAVNSKATAILQQNGVRVGLLGADMSGMSRG